MKLPILVLLAGTLAAPAAPVTIFTSAFDGNTGAHVFAGDTDNVTGSATLTITDWTTDASVTSISNLTAISDDGGGFAQTQGGAGTYANPDVAYISRNHNQSGTRRGYSFTFEVNTTWDLTTLTIATRHTNNAGNQAQTGATNLHYSLDGPSLGSPVAASVNQVYFATPGGYTNVPFDLTGTSLGTGTYTLEVWQQDLSGVGGAYATYDGITLEGDNGAAPLPTIESFTADRTYVTTGSTVNLSWETTDAATLVIDPGDHDVTSISTNGDGTTPVTVNATTTFTLTATDAGGSSTTATVEVAAGPARPNLVVFLVDDMGPQDTSVPFMLDAGGNPVAYNFNNYYVTPNMETLAASGMRFTTAYAQSVCSPTRCGIMTGRNSARHAVSDWVGAGTGSGDAPNWRSGGLDPGEVTLPKLLKDGGYRTIHIGKAHFSRSSVTPQELGFDVNIGGNNAGQPPAGYIGTAGYGGLPGLEAYDGSLFLTKALTIEANKAIEDAVDEGRPFFLHMAFYAVHAPFTTNPDAAGDYTAAANDNHEKFSTMIEGMDIAVGEIRQKLIDRGVAKDTLIVFLGDNGSDSPATTNDGLPSGTFNDFPMRGKKATWWEGGIRVPMISTWATPDPANAFQQALPIAANSIETDIVTTWDLPVTLLNVAGLPDSAADFGEDGHDLTPYLAGTPGSHRPQEVLVHYPHNHRGSYFTLLREGDMKLIYNYQNNTHKLYNLATDPTENNDLATLQPETVTRMARAMAQKLDATWGPTGVLKPAVTTSAPNGNVISIPNNPSVDVDADGLPDTTEDPDLDGLVDAGETDPDNDNTDGDNIADGAEVSLGTDPLDPNSYFFLTGNPQPDSSIILTWPSQPGTSFAIHASTDLDDWTDVIDPDVPADPGNSTSYSVPASSELREFYRVRLK